MRVSEHEGGAIQRAGGHHALGIGRQVEHQVAVIGLQGLAREPTLDTRPVVIQQRGCRALSDHLGDLVLDSPRRDRSKTACCPDRRTRAASPWAGAGAAPDTPSSSQENRCSAVHKLALSPSLLCLRLRARQSVQPRRPAYAVVGMADASRGDGARNIGARCLCRHRAPGQPNSLNYLFDSERIQRAALRDLVQIGSLGHRSCADCAELVAQVQTCRNR